MHTYEEVKTALDDKGYILIDEEYISCNNKLTFKDKDGFYYLMSFTNIRKNMKPFMCHINNPYTIQNIKLWCKLNNKPFELLDTEYKNIRTKMRWKCLKEGCLDIFKSSWMSIINGFGCGVCFGMQVGEFHSLAIKNPDLASEWHSNKNGSLTPYDVTCGSNKKVWWQCKDNPEHVWHAIISDRNDGSNCPYCSGRLPSEEYNLLVINPILCKEWNYEKNSKNPKDYTPNSASKVWWKCKECGNEWYANINNRNYGAECPECNSNSKGEKIITGILTNINIKFIPQKTFDGLVGLGNGLLSYDFYLPKLNLLIEYQGQQHEKPVDFNGYGIEYAEERFIRQQEHDKRKKQYTLDNNYNFLEIWYYNIDKIEEIINNYIFTLKETA